MATLNIKPILQNLISLLKQSNWKNEIEKQEKQLKNLNESKEKDHSFNKKQFIRDKDLELFEALKLNYQKNDSFLSSNENNSLFKWLLLEWERERKNLSLEKNLFARISKKIKLLIHLEKNLAQQIGSHHKIESTKGRINEIGAHLQIKIPLSSKMKKNLTTRITTFRKTTIPIKRIKSIQILRRGKKF